MAREKISGIYVIVNTVNGKVYVGQTSDFRTRWNKHKSSLILGIHDNRHLQAAWSKYGQDVFEFQILEHCSTKQLTEREQYYLDLYKARGNSYNIAMDAHVPARGVKRTEETRRRMSKANTGRICTEETRKKMSEANRNPPKETRQRISAAKLNPPAETRQKLSEAAKRRPPMSEETRRKISDSVKKAKALAKSQKTEELES